MKVRRALGLLPSCSLTACLRYLRIFLHSVFILLSLLAEKQVTSAQLKEHRVVVLDLSETYLKSESM